MSEFSFDVTDADFDQTVVDASHQVPVIVDFWAPWCQPCRMLKPVLEKLTADYGGQVRLAKVNSDENPESARRYGVRGIPAVKAFVGGELVDEFSGALPEKQVREFIDRLLPSRALPLLDAAQAALEAHDAATASSLLDDAEPLLRDAGDRIRLEALRARVALAMAGGADLEALQAAVAANPDDLDSRLQLANGLALDARYREACDQWLYIVQRDRTWNNEAGRKGLINLFTLLSTEPAMQDLVRENRVKLARILN